MSKKSKRTKVESGNLGEVYTLPYDAEKTATGVAGYLADGLRGKVLPNHTNDFNEEGQTSASVPHWEQWYVAFKIDGDDFERDYLEPAQASLLQVVKEAVGNRFVAFAHVDPNYPSSEWGFASRVRHVSARCQFVRDRDGLRCCLDVFTCCSGERDA